MAHTQQGGPRLLDECGRRGRLKWAHVLDPGEGMFDPGSLPKAENMKLAEDSVGIQTPSASRHATDSCAVHDREFLASKMVEDAHQPIRWRDRKRQRLKPPSRMPSMSITISCRAASSRRLGPRPMPSGTRFASRPDRGHEVLPPTAPVAVSRFSTILLKIYRRLVRLLVYSGGRVSGFRLAAVPISFLTVRATTWRVLACRTLMQNRDPWHLKMTWAIVSR